MEQKYLELIGLMDQVHIVLERLVALAQEKKRLIIQGNVKELDNLIREEGLVISELEKWEGARFRAQKQINPHQPALNARDLLRLLASDCPHLSTAFQDALIGLETSLESLRKLNEHNHELLQQSLNHIAFLEAALVGDQPGLYSPNGLQAGETRTRLNLLDRRV